MKVELYYDGQTVKWTDKGAIFKATSRIMV